MLKIAYQGMVRIQTAPLTVRICNAPSPVPNCPSHQRVDEHAAAVNRMHTGRPVSGTRLEAQPGIHMIQARWPGGAHDSVSIVVQ